MVYISASIKCFTQVYKSGSCYKKRVVEKKIRPTNVVKPWMLHVIGQLFTRSFQKLDHSRQVK